MINKNNPEKININTGVNSYDYQYCPNCGHKELGKYCPDCGQSNKNFNKPFKEIIGDLLDSVNLDVRLLNTIIPFFIKPGFLAKQYFEGKRKRYVPPLRLYMISSIIFFFLLQYVSKNKNNNFANLQINETSDTLSYKFSDKNIKKDSALKEVFNITFEKADSLKIIENDSTRNKRLKKSILKDLDTSQKRALFFDKFLKNVSYVLFFLMPLFALFLALTLWKSKMLYIKHLIFSVNFHSFIFGLFSLVILLEIIFPGTISNYSYILILGIPLYLMSGIKRFYNRTYLRAIFKTIGILTFYSLIVFLVIVILVIFTLSQHKVS